MTKALHKNVYKYDDMKRSEHMAVRQTAGWYFFTHQIMEVTGEDAAAFLDHLFPNAIANLPVGRERYTTMLDENAEIIDDVVVFHLKESVYWVSTLFIWDMLKWFDFHKGTYRVSYRNITGTQHMYAIQGPKSLEMVNSLTKTPVDSLKFFSFSANEIDGKPVLINRAGFTGEKYGYEIYIAAEEQAFLEERLRAAGERIGARQVTEFQVMAWSLPTEAGFYYMRDLRHCNPLEVGLERGIQWDKDFIGKAALLRIREAGPEREMLGFTMEEADTRVIAKQHGGPGSVVTVDGEEVGRVSKLTYSYVREEPIGYILAQRGRLKVGDHVVLKGEYDAVITERAFL